MSFEPYQLIKARELSKLLCMDRHTIVEWAKRGMIPSIRLGKFWLFDVKEVFDCLKENRSIPMVHKKEKSKIDEINRRVE